MMQIKVCEHYKNKFGNIPLGTDLLLYLDLNTVNIITIEYLKHLKENQSCYAYSDLTQPVDEILNQIKNNLQEMLRMLE
jgi:hypothetical protein